MSGVQASGLSEIRDGFAQVADQVRAMPDELADLGADILRDLTPVLSGALVRTVAGTVVGPDLIISAGAGLAYAGPVLARVQALERTQAELENRAPQIVEDHVQGLIEKAGLD